MFCVIEPRGRKTWLLQTLAAAILIAHHPSYLHASSINSAKRDTNAVNLLLDSAYALESVDSKAALSVYKRANLLSKAINFSLGQAKSYHYSGIVHSDRSEYTQALSMYKKALAFYQQIKNKRGEGACYTNIGNLFHFQSQLDSALFYYQRSIKPFEQSAQKDALSQAYSNAGVIFQKLGQYGKSNDYQVKAVQLARMAADSVALSRALINQSAVLFEMKDYNKFLAAAREALQISQKIDDAYSLQLVHINMADYYKQKQDYFKAIEYGLLGLKYALKLGTPYDVADIRKRIGDLYYLRKEYKTAETFYKEALREVSTIKAPEIAAGVYFALQKMYARSGAYKKAYHYQSLAQQYQDSTFGEKQLKIINELEVKYQASQKEEALTRQRLQISQKELELQKSRRYILIAAVAALLALFSVGGLILHFRHRRRLHQKELKSLRQEKEIQILQALMQGEEKERSRIARDLHDEVAGMLAAARMHMESLALQARNIVGNKGFSKAVNLLDEASVSVRKTAHHLMPEILMLDGLDKAIRRYCNSLSNDNLKVQYDCWTPLGRLEDGFELAIYRIVQELLNNAIKHAYATRIMVQLTAYDGLLSITIEDNGVGFNPETADTGAGMLTLQTRVEALNGTIDIDAQEGEGVSIYLEFKIPEMHINPLPETPMAAAL